MRRDRREDGAALVLALILVVLALSVTALLVVTSRSATRAAAERMERTQARFGARSGLHVALDDLARGGTGSLDGRADSLASIRPAGGPPADLRVLEDGSFTVRAEPAGADADGPHYIVTAFAKWGGTVKGVRAAVVPVRQRPFPAGFFGERDVEVAAPGRVVAIDARAADPEAALAESVDVLGSNGEVALGVAETGANGSAAGAGGPFRGAIYAPLADVLVISTPGPPAVYRPTGWPAPAASVQGGPPRALAVQGNAIPGRGHATKLGPLARVLGSTASRAAAAPLPPAGVVPPPDSLRSGPFAVPAGATERLLPGALAVDSLSVEGTLEVLGATEHHVAGDLDLSGAGRIVLGKDASLKIHVGGAARLRGAGIANPGPARRLVVISSGSSVELAVRGSLTGAVAGRTLKVVGDGLALRYDRALEAEGFGPRSYRASAVVETAAPW